MNQSLSGILHVIFIFYCLPFITIASSYEGTNYEACVASDAIDSDPRSLDIFEQLFRPLEFEKFIVDFLEKQPIVLRRRGIGFYGYILNFDDIDNIIKNAKHPNDHSLPLQYGVDFKLVRMLIREGEWWSGVLPKDKISLEYTHEMFRKGFTVIIHQVQRHCAKVYQLAQFIESALGYRVNVNLYLSPPNSHGFEAHFDWMDGIILQLEGTKLWRTYSPHAVSYPRPDMMYRPNETSANNNNTKEGTENSSEEFLLSPGDLIYLPRGIVHEATTNTTLRKESSSKTFTKSDSEESHQSDDDGISLHLTFGLEIASIASLEILFHHIIYSSFRKMQGIPDTFPSFPTFPNSCVPPPVDPSSQRDATSLCFQSEAIRILLPALPKSNEYIRNESVEYETSEDGTSSAVLTNNEILSVRNLLHVFISYYASLKSGVSVGSSRLRRALGVTKLTIEVPSLSPSVATVDGSRLMLRYLSEQSERGELAIDFLVFLAERQKLSIILSTTGNTSSSDITLLPASPPASLSADFKLTYLHRFLGDVGGSGYSKPTKGHRAKTSTSSTGMAPEGNYFLVFERDALTEEEQFALVDPTSSNVSVVTSTSTSVMHYRPMILRQLLLSKFRGKWSLLDDFILSAVRSVFSTYANPLSREESESKSHGGGDGATDIFCRSWSRFMEDIVADGLARKEAYLASLKAAGENLWPVGVEETGKLANDKFSTRTKSIKKKQKEKKKDSSGI